MKRFLVIFSGQTASLLGSELVQFALIWWLTKTGGSATALATAALVGLLPPVVLGPFAGALIDRWNRRTVMIAADLLIASATLALAVLFATGTARIPHVYGAIFVRALGGAFHWPAMQAATSLMVPRRHLTRIAGMNQALRGIASIAMPPLGALLLVAFPISVILAIDIGTAALAVATLAMVRVPEPEKAERKGGAAFWDDMREGVRYVARRPGLALLIALIAVLHFLAAPAFALVPVAVKGLFAGGVFELAWIQSASGVGLLLGGLLLGVWGGFKRRMLTILLGLGLLGVCLASFGLLPSDAFRFAVALMLGAGALASTVVGSFQAIQQAIVPPEIQGRVFTLSRSGIDAMSPLGMVIAGPTADGLGLRGWYLATGTVMAIMAAVAFFIPTLLRLEDKEEEK